MELLKRNIHMDRVCCKADTQFTLEDDVNLSDHKPDITRILFTKGEVCIDDVRCTEHRIQIKGKLLFHILYESEDAYKRLFQTGGELPFEEVMNADGISSSDIVNIQPTLENLTVGLINSRKMSVKSLILLCGIKEELYDEEVSINVESDSPVECRKVTHNFCGIAVQKKDIFRIKTEQEIPSDYPNIDEILWQEPVIRSIEFKALEDKLSVRGDIGVFIIYSAQTDDTSYRFFETLVPFSGTIDCAGSSENMICDISYRLGQKEVDVRSDVDGEERIIGIDLVIDLSIKLYSEESLEMIHDLYGIQGEIATQTKTGYCKKVLGHHHSKLRISEQVQVDVSDKSILKLNHSSGVVNIDHCSEENDGIQVEGTLSITTLYSTLDDHFPFAAIDYEVPFSTLLEISDMQPGSKYHLDYLLEDLAVTQISENELDVKAILVFSAICLIDEPITLLCSATETEPDTDTINNLPGIVAYYVKEGDTLWQIGKEYYVPVNRIREVNGLTSDLLHVGDKLLIMK